MSQGVSRRFQFHRKNLKELKKLCSRKIFATGGEAITFHNLTMARARETRRVGRLPMLFGHVWHTSCILSGSQDQVRCVQRETTKKHSFFET